jgi:EAL domain-containing protein (putative c-di-GMP-specific phosphodiesterase class I)
LLGFRIDKLKIDRELLSDNCNNAHDAEIVKATLALAKALGLITTAEGAET